MFFFISAVAVIAVAVVAIAHNQGWHIAGQTASKGNVVRSPHLVNCLLQIVSGGAVAIGVNVVGSVADLNRGAGKTSLGTARGQWHVVVVGRLLVRVRIIPRVFSDPEINVIVVVELDVPGITGSTFSPVKLARLDRGVQRIRRTSEMFGRTKV